ncbi:MAG: DNA polymerase III subunit delta' [Pyrinomonadaceae bacterium]|nr:DNA polymerase III subunit delta' [Pyrinomonadaceae bacterium]
MFDELLGNEQLKETFVRLTKSGRIPHSALFVGRSGIGKKLFALEIAKYFACKTPVEFASCGNCTSCIRGSNFIYPRFDDKDSHKKVIFSEHPDIGTVIPYRNNILVDSIRDLEKEANYRPYEANARCFIIDDADRLNDAASNALLKTLEEPAGTTYIFLIASNPNSLLPTIRSRCQMFRFSPLQPEMIEELLFEKMERSSEDAKFLSKISNGSIGGAVNADADWLSRRAEFLLSLLENITFNRDFLTILQTAEELNDVKDKDQYELSLKVLQTIIHDILLLKTSKEGGEIVNDHFSDRLEILAAKVDILTLARWQSEVDLLRKNLRFNLNRKIAADALFLKMAG